MRFKKFMAGETDIDATSVEQPQGCDFGKWLYGPGRSDLGGSFAEIECAHTAFHKSAADVVRKKKSGDQIGAEKALDATGAFTQAGAKLTLLIVKAREY